MEALKTAPPSASHIAELQQLRDLASEQQRSVQSFTLQLQKVETREESLKLEVHRLKDLLDKEEKVKQDIEDQHLQVRMDFVWFILCEIVLVKSSISILIK